ncbi:Signal peptidase I [Candidatus Arthromitus sp. SFB-mouse-NL]|uniref:signal peptidase I n=1 Tax=Candidatus Arthromitus sp. SFB-mouse-NL TaxID=1508644 RepID=UPI00049A1EFC|nr:signal peptidase I [Candidatus Arthromitus sp. SFB-mouse-NL]AID44266.1 Signal peptidase I [Candidatus Arthromitus sp. SFB-mouse-NL]
MINRLKFNNRLIYILLWIIFIIIIPVYLANNLVKSVFFVTVTSNSMYPTVKSGDRLIIYRNYRNIKRNDIIVFYSEELDKNLIKRVIAVPGDIIDLDENLNLMVNGEKVAESNYFINRNYLIHNQFVVPDESYFVIGDNFDNSFDSRFWNNKFVCSNSILGRAVILFYPIERFKYLFI